MIDVSVPLFIAAIQCHWLHPVLSRRAHRGTLRVVPGIRDGTLMRTQVLDTIRQSYHRVSQAFLVRVLISYCHCFS